MFASKSLFVLLLTAVAFAAPSARRQLEEGATCAYVVTPSSSADGINVAEELNFTIGREIADEADSGIFNGGLSPEPNGDGSFTATGTISADSLTADQLKELVTAWPGKTLEGLPKNGLTWKVVQVTCE
ncbi:hypothetical protein AAF712_003334 [Marasmius tenuissimus]|uniref:Uncharacterized protein n=1 Tax=Marasmius tenuissimus TaxID=585030 RepID=A0ABR3A8L7_9AGAR|nr:hypothetical protein PM082_012190 [Marasmius tenuissimus]